MNKTEIIRRLSAMLGEIETMPDDLCGEDCLPLLRIVWLDRKTGDRLAFVVGVTNDEEEV